MCDDGSCKKDRSPAAIAYATELFVKMVDELVNDPFGDWNEPYLPAATAKKTAAAKKNPDIFVVLDIEWKAPPLASHTAKNCDPGRK